MLLRYKVGNRGVAKMVNKWVVAAFYASFSVGLGPLTMVHSTEALPFKVRAQVVGIVVMVNKLLSFALYYLKPAMYIVFLWFLVLEHQRDTGFGGGVHQQVPHQDIRRSSCACACAIWLQ
ncbi:unnamed protein product [Linum trigynum]